MQRIPPEFRVYVGEWPNLREVPCQGTTSVVPKTRKKNAGLYPLRDVTSG
jgi:hypothetical protein